MSTPKSKPRLIKESPFSRLTARTEDTGNIALKDAREIDIAKIVRNPHNPRRVFDKASLDELAQDIQVRGILQPLIVRPLDDDTYEIVVGERRYQAALQIGLERLPALVKAMDDKEAEETSLIENIQRENLSLTDEATFFKMLKTKYGYSLREIASEVAHKSHSYVEARLNLAEYPDLLQLIETKQLGLQKALELIRSGDEGEIKKVIANSQSLDNSQSVILKDKSLDNSQSLEKKVTERPKSLQPLTPAGELAQSLKMVAKRLEKTKSSDSATLLEVVEDLEQQLTIIKAKLKH